MRRMYSLEQLKEVVKEVIKSGQVENAKPLYYHGIYAAETSTNEARLTFMIINNDSEAFTKTTFPLYVKNLMDEFNAVIQVNGYFMANSICYNAYGLMKTGSSYLIYGNDTSGNRGNISFSSLVFNTFEDGVNKLN